MFNKIYNPIAEEKRRKVIKMLNQGLCKDYNIHLDTKVKSQGANRHWQGSGRYKWTFEQKRENHSQVSSIGSMQSIHELSKCIAFGWGAGTGEIWGFKKEDIPAGVNVYYIDFEKL